MEKSSGVTADSLRFVRVRTGGGANMSMFFHERNGGGTDSPCFVRGLFALHAVTLPSFFLGLSSPSSVSASAVTCSGSCGYLSTHMYPLELTSHSYMVKSHTCSGIESPRLVEL